MSTTRKTLSDDAKNARMEAWAAKLGLSKTQLKEFQYKYGPYAYTIMQKAMTHPTDLMKAIGEGYKNSKAAILHFVDKDISSDKIAKVVGERSALKVDNAIAKAKIDDARKEVAEMEAGKRDLAVAKKKEEQKKAKEKQDRVVAKVEKKKEEKKTPVKTVEKKKEPTRTVAQKPKEEPKKEQPTTTFPTQWQIPEPKQNVAAMPIDSTHVTIKPIITKEGQYNVLKSQAFVGNKPIVELKDSTDQSLFGVTHRREVGVTDNPVGKKGFDGRRNYYGAMQHNPDGIKNLSLYALMHPEKYGDYANKVFRTSDPTFKKDFENFKKAVEKNGKDAYGVMEPLRKKLLSHLKPDYLKTFEQEGKKHSEQMLQLQRDGGSEVTAAFYNLQAIENVLKKKGLSLTQVNPSVIGMVVSVGIAKGNITGMSALFAGKSLKQINSPEMIQSIANKYRTVFHSKSELNAVQWAKDHVNEKHSVTTMRELSMMMGNEQIYENYLAKVAQAQPKQNTGTQLANGQGIQPLNPVWSNTGRPA